MNLRLIVTLCFVMMFTSSSLGQNTPSMEASLGYSFLRAANFNRHGWVGSAAGNINHWFGVKGQVAGDYTDLPHRDAHSFLGGAQFTLRRNSGFTPWSQFLAGVVRTGQGAGLDAGSFFTGGPPVFLPLTRSDFALQPGGGIDFWLRPRLGIRLGADYRRRFGINSAHRDSYQSHVGIVFRTSLK